MERDVKGMHELHLRNREELSLEGILDVESFDEQEIILETEEGALIIRGEEMHIRQLNIEAGKVQVHGLIRGVEYLGESLSKRSKGILGRLFK